MAALLVRQWRENALGRALWSYALFLFAFFFVSRFLNENYLGYIVAFLALGMRWHRPPGSQGREPKADARGGARQRLGMVRLTLRVALPVAVARRELLQRRLHVRQLIAQRVRVDAQEAIGVCGPGRTAIGVG